jgi:hypothetical protein
MQKSYTINDTISVVYQIVNGDEIDIDVPIAGKIYTDSGDRLDPPDTDIQVFFDGNLDDFNDLIGNFTDNTGQEVTLDLINEKIQDYIGENLDDYT